MINIGRFQVNDIYTTQFRILYIINTYHDNTLENKVLYECSFCHKRFARQEFLDKHIAKGLWSTEHQRHRVEEVIHHSQLLFLQQVGYIYIFTIYMH